MYFDRFAGFFKKPKPAKVASPRFNFCMPVWGRRYVEVMLNAGLLSQLTPGNLLDFPWLDESIYEIYTTSMDRKIIESHPAFAKLRGLIKVRFICIDGWTLKGKWNVFRRCQQKGVRSADARQAAIFFMCPDQIWAEGSMTNAARHIVAGRSAVLCPGPRSVEETMVPALRKDWLSEDGLSLSIPARALVDAGLKNLHPDTRSWFWDNPNYFGFPTYILFDVLDEGVSAFCYILHPVVLNAEVRNAPFKKIFDQDYLEAACPNVEKIYVIKDTDEVFHFEVSPHDAHTVNPALFEGDRIEAMMWHGEWQHNPHHRVFGKIPIRIHRSECDEKAWQAVEMRGKSIVDEIDRGWRLSDEELLATRPLNLIRRIEARYRFNRGDMSKLDQELLKLAESKAGVSESVS